MKDYIKMFWSLHDDMLDGSYRDFTDWETDFLESMADKLEDGYKMSDKEEDIIEKLYDKVYNSTW